MSFYIFALKMKQQQYFVLFLSSSKYSSHTYIGKVLVLYLFYGLENRGSERMFPGP